MSKYKDSLSLVFIHRTCMCVYYFQNDIMDVNQIFKELGTMIYTQGEVVDSIESSVEFATQNVEAGTAQLSKAGDYQVRTMTLLRHQNVHVTLSQQ